MARRDRAGTTVQGDSPAIRLLDAMRAGDYDGVLAVCGETTTVAAENMGWSCRGRDEIHEMLTAVRDRFPGITFQSRTRHVGFGLVIDEARVQDDGFDEPVAGHDEPETAAEATADDVTAKHVAAPDPDVHPMWDEPVTEKRAGLTLWRETTSDHITPTRLNMPVRVTVRHDDLQVHDVTLSFPAALLKGALGMHVDPFEMSLSEVQSAFIAPVGAGFASYELARPELALVPPAPEVEQSEADDEPPRKRRRRVLPVLLLLLAVLAGGGWWAVQGRDTNQTAGTPTSSPTVEPQNQPSASASPSTSPTKKPVVTHEQPSQAPSRKPTVTLTSDLAFDKNSAALSGAAKVKIDDIASQVKAAGLTGKIYVNGYTDNLGSAASGITLSRKRAEAVSNYLGSQLVGVPVSIVVVANGEKHPIASNDTEAGRAQNRRVTITLPKP